MNRIVWGNIDPETMELLGTYTVYNKPFIQFMIYRSESGWMKAEAYASSVYHISSAMGDSLSKLIDTLKNECELFLDDLIEEMGR